MLKDVFKFDVTEFNKLTANQKEWSLKGIAFRLNLIDDETGDIDISDISALKEGIINKMVSLIKTSAKDAKNYEDKLARTYVDL